MTQPSPSLGFSLTGPGNQGEAAPWRGERPSALIDQGELSLPEGFGSNTCPSLYRLLTESRWLPGKTGGRGADVIRWR